MQQTLVNSVSIWYDLSTKSLLVGTKIWAIVWSVRPESKNSLKQHTVCFLHNSQILISFFMFLVSPR